MELTQPVSVLKRRPALAAANGVHLSALPCVPDGERVCPAVTLSWAGSVLNKNRGWSVVLWVPFQSRGGEIFLLQEI